jgi:hypothetical protein
MYHTVMAVKSFFVENRKKAVFLPCAGIGNQQEGNQRPGLNGTRPGAVVNGAVQALR